jgi:hypothetical protein
MDNPIKCPICCLINPANAIRCDCGHYFKNKPEPKKGESEEEPLRFYIVAAKKKGPVSKNTLKEMLATGQIKPGTLVW